MQKRRPRGSGIWTFDRRTTLFSFFLSHTKQQYTPHPLFPWERAPKYTMASKHRRQNGVGGTPEVEDPISEVQNRFLALRLGFQASDLRYTTHNHGDHWVCRLKVGDAPAVTSIGMNSKREAKRAAAQLVLNQWPDVAHVLEEKGKRSGVRVWRVDAEDVKDRIDHSPPGSPPLLRRRPITPPRMVNLPSDPAANIRPETGHDHEVLRENIRTLYEQAGRLHAQARRMEDEAHAAEMRLRVAKNAGKIYVCLKKRPL